MFTRWDILLWLCGCLAGFGAGVLVMHFAPRRFYHHFDFTFRHGHRFRFQTDDDDPSEAWKKL